MFSFFIIYMNKEEYEKRKIALITERNRMYNKIKNMVIKNVKENLK